VDERAAIEPLKGKRRGRTNPRIMPGAGEVKLGWQSTWELKLRRLLADLRVWGEGIVKPRVRRKPDVAAVLVHRVQNGPNQPTRHPVKEPVPQLRPPGRPIW